MGLLFAPEEMTVAQVFDFSGEGGLIRPPCILKDSVNGQGTSEISFFLLDASGLGSSTSEPEVLGLVRASGGGA